MWHIWYDHVLRFCLFWAHLCKLHGGLICIAFRLSVHLSVTKIRLDNNSYLVKYCSLLYKAIHWNVLFYIWWLASKKMPPLSVCLLYMHFICANLKVGFMSTSSCIFLNYHGPGKRGQRTKKRIHAIHWIHSWHVGYLALCISCCSNSIWFIKHVNRLLDMEVC